MYNFVESWLGNAVCAKEKKEYRFSHRLPEVALVKVILGSKTYLKIYRQV
jgi:hypothetical protein